MQQSAVQKRQSGYKERGMTVQALGFLAPYKKEAGVAKTAEKASKKKRQVFFCRSNVSVASGRRFGFVVDTAKRFRLVLTNEAGFLEMQLLTFFLMFFLTVLGFIAGMGICMYKQAYAKYMYLQESASFAVSAANMTGEVGDIEHNKDVVKMFFEAAMDDMVGDYKLKKFYAVEEGDVVSGGSRAQYPGYVIEAEVPIEGVVLPFLGEQSVVVPMKYFVVTQSQREF